MQTILFINPFAGYGGAEQSLTCLMKQLVASKNYDVHLLLPDSGVLSEIAHEAGVSLHYVRPPAAFTRLSQKTSVFELFHFCLLFFLFPVYLLNVASVVRNVRPHIIHTNGIKSHLISGLLPVVYGKRHLVWHARRVVDNVLLRAVLRVLSFRVSAVVSNSNFLAHRVPVPTNLVTTVYNPIDCQTYKKSGHEDVVNSFPQLEGRRIILVVSVLAHTKGVDVIISSLAKLLHEREDALLVIVGDDIYRTAGNDGYRQRLERLAKEHLPKNAVLFAGFQKNITRWLSIADVLIHFPESEAFGRVVAEALACEVPVVASSIGGIPEIVDDGETGFLVPLDSPGELGGKVCEILDSTDLKVSMGRKGRQNVLSRFSPDTHTAGIMNLYEKLFGNI